MFGIVRCWFGFDDWLKCHVIGFICFQLILAEWKMLYVNIKWFKWLLATILLRSSFTRHIRHNGRCYVLYTRSNALQKEKEKQFMNGSLFFNKRNFTKLLLILLSRNTNLFRLNKISFCSVYCTSTAGLKRE